MRHDRERNGKLCPCFHSASHLKKTKSLGVAQRSPIIYNRCDFGNLMHHRKTYHETILSSNMISCNVVIGPLLIAPSHAAIFCIFCMRYFWVISYYPYPVMPCPQQHSQPLDVIKNAWTCRWLLPHATSLVYLVYPGRLSTYSMDQV